ncbi:MAG: extracellular solute-binding protein [Haloechinothrix sp.]
MNTKAIRLAKGAAVSIAALLLASCSATGGEEAPAVGEFEGRGPITYVAGKDATGTVQQVIDDWNTEHPGEKVTFVELPTDADSQRQQMIQNAETRSDAYTVLALDAVWTSEFAANRWIDELPADQFALDAMLPPVVETAKYQDRLFAAPDSSDGGLLYYRTDLLGAAGIDDPPSSFAELEADCDKILRLPEADGMSCFAGQYEKYEGLTVNAAEAITRAADRSPTTTATRTSTRPKPRRALTCWLRASPPA